MANLSILAKLGVDSTSLKAGLLRAKQNVANFAKSAGGKLLALAGIGGFGMVIRSAIAFGSTVSDLATRTGTTVEQFGALRDVSRDAGVEQSVLERGLRNVALRAQEAADGNKEYQEAIERLGIDMKTFLGLDTAAKFEAVSQAAAGAANQSEAFADVAKIMGERAGPQLTEVLRKVAREGLGNMTDSLLKTGAIMDNQTAVSLDKLEDQLQRLKDQVIISAGSFIVDMLPAIKSVAAGVIGFVKENKEVLIVLAKVVAMMVTFKVTTIAVAKVQAIYTAALAARAAAAKAATQATVALNVATKATPWGALIGVVTAAATAVALFGGSTSDATTKLKEASDEIKELTERSKVAKATLADLAKKVQQLNKVKALKAAGMNELQSALELEKETLKVSRAQTQEARDRVKEIPGEIALLKEKAKAHLERFGEQAQEMGMGGALEIAVRLKLEKEIKKLRLEYTEQNAKILQGNLDQEASLKRIKEQTAQTAKNRAAANTAIADARKEFEASVNPSAKLRQDAEKLVGLRARQAELSAKAHRLTVKEVEELHKNELKILGIEKSIADAAKDHADTIKNDLNAAREDELAKLRQALDLQKQGADEEERKRDAAKDAALEKEKEAAAVRKELAAAQQDLDKFAPADAGPENRAQKFKRLMRERQKRMGLFAGPDPATEAAMKAWRQAVGVGDFKGDFNDWQQAAAEAKKKRDDLAAKAKKVADEALKLRKKEKEHAIALAKIREKIATRDKAILDLRKKLNDKELLTLEQLTEARKKLEALLAQAEKGINVNVRVNGGPGAGGGLQPVVPVVAENRKPKQVVTSTAESAYRDDVATEQTMKRVAVAVEGRYVNT